MVRVSAPASIGNFGPGFDALGMAVRGLDDIVEAERIDAGVEVTGIENADDLPLDPEKNTAAIAAREVLKLLGEPGGVRLRLIKGVPGGSGLGSSAASAAAGAVAADHLYGNRLGRKALLLAATSAERAVSGGWFTDNTAPAIYGGAAAVSRGASPLEVVPLGTISALRVVLLLPDARVRTEASRAALPETVPLDAFADNLAYSCGITAAFLKNDYRLLTRSLGDRVLEPARAPFIPAFGELRAAALRAGADAFLISGSGPSCFAVTDSDLTARSVEAALTEFCHEHGLSCRCLVTEADPRGARIARERPAPAGLARAEGMR